MKYPDWQADYLAAVMEENIAQLAKKMYLAEAAIFIRQWVLASSDGTNNAEELKALADAVKGLRVLVREKLNHPDWK